MHATVMMNTHAYNFYPIIHTSLMYYVLYGHIKWGYLEDSHLKTKGERTIMVGGRAP